MMGANRAQRQGDQQDSQNKASAEANRYSPWTNKSYEYNRKFSPSAFEGAVGGGVQGLGISQSLGGFGGAKTSQMDVNADALAGQPQSSPWSANNVQPQEDMFNAKQTLFNPYRAMAKRTVVG